MLKISLWWVTIFFSYLTVTSNLSCYTKRWHPDMVRQKFRHTCNYFFTSVKHQLELLVGIKLEKNNLVAMKRRFLFWEEITGQMNYQKTWRKLFVISHFYPWYTTDIKFVPLNAVEKPLAMEKYSWSHLIPIFF